MSDKIKLVITVFVITSIVVGVGSSVYVKVRDLNKIIESKDATIKEKDNDINILNTRLATSISNAERLEASLKDQNEKVEKKEIDMANRLKEYEAITNTPILDRYKNENIRYIYTEGDKDLNVMLEKISEISYEEL